MGHTHPLNYYLVYCPIAITMSFFQSLKNSLHEQRRTKRHVLATL